MSDVATLHEFVKLALWNLPPGAPGCLTGAADTEATLLSDRMALDSIASRPNFMNVVREIDRSSALYGVKVGCRGLLCEAF